MADEFEPFTNIRHALEKAVEPFGVKFRAWELKPGDEDGEKPFGSFILEILPEAFLGDEQKEFRKKFEDIEVAEKELEAMARLDEQAREVKEDLLHVTKRGIFDEEEDDLPGV